MNLNSTIEHTLLKPQSTRADIRELCAQALEHRFAGVCVPPVYVAEALDSLSLAPTSNVRCVSVVGFSSGAFLTSTKAFEARQIAKQGAHEIDMVMAIWALKNGDKKSVVEDILRVKEACLEQNANVVLKVIIETALLSDDEKKWACECCLLAGAHYVKTSTGAFEGAKVADIKLIKDCVQDQAKIKASGGIRDLTFARELLAAGASRLGTSAGVKLCAGEVSESSY